MNAVRHLMLTTALIAASACSWLGTSAPPAADPDAPVLSRDLPAGNQRSDGSIALYLKVETATDGSLTLADAEDEASATLVLSFTQRDEAQTMVSLKSAFARPLKLDLYISPDGEHYVYTSSCPVLANGSSFESWPHAVAWIAIANPRAVPDGEMACR